MWLTFRSWGTEATWSPTILLHVSLKQNWSNLNNFLTTTRFIDFSTFCGPFIFRGSYSLVKKWFCYLVQIKKTCLVKILLKPQQRQFAVGIYIDAQKMVKYFNSVERKFAYKVSTVVPTTTLLTWILTSFCYFRKQGKIRKNFGLTKIYFEKESRLGGGCNEGLKIQEYWPCSSSGSNIHIWPRKHNCRCYLDSLERKQLPFQENFLKLHLPYPEYEDSWKPVACCAWLHIHNVLIKGVQY